jgi:hypothetical protein
MMKFSSKKATNSRKIQKVQNSAAAAAKADEDLKNLVFTKAVESTKPSTPLLDEG